MMMEMVVEVGMVMGMVMGCSYYHNAHDDDHDDHNGHQNDHDDHDDHNNHDDDHDDFSLVTCGLQPLQLQSCLKGKPPLTQLSISSSLSSSS